MKFNGTLVTNYGDINNGLYLFIQCNITVAVSLGSYRVSLGWCVVCFSLRKYCKGLKSTYYGLHTPGWRDNDFIIHWCRLLSNELNVSLAIYISINVEYCLHTSVLGTRGRQAQTLVKTYDSRLKVDLVMYAT